MTLWHRDLTSYHNALRECIASGEHLQSTDDDGYCNGCGFDDNPDETTMKNMGVQPNWGPPITGKPTDNDTVTISIEGTDHELSRSEALWLAQAITKTIGTKEVLA